MDYSEDYSLVSPCGIYCGDCAVYKVKDNPELKPILLKHGVKEEQMPCPGCRAVDGNCPHLEGRCEHYACAEKHDVVMCYECEEFPCNKLHPTVDRANILPHNLKMFCQGYIKLHGLEAWIEKYPEIKKRYFTGKLSYGKGPLLDDEVTNT